MSIPGLPEIPPSQEVTEDLRDIIRLCLGAADFELLSQPAPVSRIRNPDGSPQGETPAERTRRVAETVIMYAIENGLLVVPGDIAERLDDYFPVQRAQPAPGMLAPDAVSTYAQMLADVEPEEGSRP